MASNFDKMAVTVDNQSANSPVNEQNCKDETDQKAHAGGQKIFTDGTHKKKGTFKITSVTKSNRSGSGEAPSGDMDADSLDDLDETVESHTEDASSEILDSSKYDEGVDQESPVEDMNQSFGQDTDTTTSKETKEKSDGLSTRFKVVKIETKEPFRRGRWTCHDSLNTHTIEGTDTKVTKEGNSGNSSAGSSIHYVHGVDDPGKNPIQGITSTQQHVEHTENQADKNQSQGNIVIQNSSHMSMAGQVPGHGQSVWSDGTQIQSQGVTTSGASYGIQPNPSNSNLNQMPNLRQGIAGQSNTNLPGNIPSQGHLQNPYQATGMINIMSTGSSSQSQTPGGSPMSVPTGNQSVPLSQGQHHVPMTQGHVVSLPSSQHVTQGQVQTAMQTQVENSQHSTNGVPLTSNTIPNTSVNSHSIIVSSSGTDSTQAMPLVSDIGGHPPSQMTAQKQHNQQQPDKANMTQIAQAPISSLPHDATIGVIEKPGQQSINASSSQSDQGATDQIMSEMKPTNPVTATPPNSVNSSHNLHIGATSLLTPMAVAEVVGGISSPTKEDQESGSSTVAIDNKIEKAMDLVKSHLMYAVREEVEVLKEQIKGLIEKNSQLEHENNILKSAASQETLAKLAQPRHPQPPSSSSS